MSTVKRQALIVAAAVAIGVAAYLGWSAATGAWGFALDDAWIHQTYARNLVATGQFAFVPGQPSAGSTSPLWTLLVSIGYLFRADKWWTYALGAVCLAATALGVWRLSLRLFPHHPGAALAAGIFCALEWHLIWAAISGMETVLFTALSTWLLVATLDSAVDPRLETRDVRPSSFTIRHAKRSFTGLLCGLLVLTRPEGLLLVGLILLAQAAQAVQALFYHSEQKALAFAQSKDSLSHVTEFPRRQRRTAQSGSFQDLSGIAWILVVLAIVLAPWLAFNLQASGTPFPNTFYAKQQEYAVLLATVPFARRVIEVFFAPFVGAQVLLIPGLAAAAWSLMRSIARPATWPRLAPLAWVIAHLGLYAVRLPVTFQHGRYEMPVIPALIAFGVGGTATFLRWNDARLWPRVLSRAAVLTLAITLVAFVAIGARAYATDVAIIQGEMVSVARWLDAHAAPGDLIAAPGDLIAAPGDLIAAHDIGAIGYFARRPLIDMAGLVSPEVIPFIRDENQLWAYIRQRGAVYLVTFPSWYPHITSQPGLVPVFAGSAHESPEHMTVYRLPAR